MQPDTSSASDALATLDQAAPYADSRFNATRHGILAQATVLAWENQAEFNALHLALIEEHSPAGPTEEHLVEELAGVIWRKRRARQAEGAVHNRALHRASEIPAKTIGAALIVTGQKPGHIAFGDAMAFPVGSLPEVLAELASDEQVTERTIEAVASGSATYAQALALLTDSSRDSWVEQLTWASDDYAEGVTPYSAELDDLLRFLTEETLPWYNIERARLRALSLVRQQALGESFDPDRLERLSRYEVHLDRKLERTLSTLLRLKDMRKAQRIDPAA